MDSTFVKVVPFPSFMSCSARSILAKNSSFVIRVESARFSAANFLTYLMARLMRLSS